jgi:hypothetical protein
MAVGWQKQQKASICPLVPFERPRLLGGEGGLEHLSSFILLLEEATHDTGPTESVMVTPSCAEGKQEW